MIAAAHIANTPEAYARVRDFFRQTCAAQGLSTNGMDMEDAEDFVESLYATRLICPVWEDKAGEEERTVYPKHERFLIRWFSAMLDDSDAALPRALREKTGLQDAELYELTAACFILLLQNARTSDWMKKYIEPLKTAVREEVPTLPPPSKRWNEAVIQTITDEQLQNGCTRLPDDALLRRAVNLADNDLLRALLGEQNPTINDYLEQGKRYLVAGLAEEEDTTDTGIQTALAQLKSGRIRLEDAVPLIADFLGGWDDGLGLLASPNRKEKKLEYRILRHIFFLLLGGDEDLYGTQEDFRDLTIQIGLSVGMKGTKLDEFLKQTGHPGIDYKGIELFYAYAADRFETAKWMHARAMQAIYEKMCTVRTAKTAASRLQATTFYRCRYAKENWSTRTPRNLMAQCQKDNMPWQRFGPNVPRCEASSQLAELRHILIDLEYYAADTHTETETDQYKLIRDAIQNENLARNFLSDFDVNSEGYQAFLAWGTLPGRDGKPGGFRRRLNAQTEKALGPYYPADPFEMATLYNREREVFWYPTLPERSERIDLASDDIEVFSLAASRALNALRTGRWLPRDAFVQLLFLRFLVTYAAVEGKPLPNDPDKVLEIFQQESTGALEHCRLLPYDVQAEELLTQNLRDAAQRYLIRTAYLK